MIKQIGMFLRWLVFNSLFIWAVILATSQGSEGAKNIVLFWVTFIVIGSFFSISNKEVIEKRAKTGFAVYGWVDVIITAIPLTVLVWHGWWYSAIATFLILCFSQALRDKVEEKQKINAKLDALVNAELAESV